MRFTSCDDYVLFEKIRKPRRREENYFDRKYEKEISEQEPGNVHLIEDQKVKFDSRKRDFYYNKLRPGVVRRGPEPPKYETEWIPFSTKISNRNPSEVVFLSNKSDGVDRNCCALLIFRRMYKCFTLSEKKSRISQQKMNEINNKVDKL